MSVNGRPFRPDPTSYQMTGIPCGNPMRYKSKGVIRMVPDKATPFEDQQIGIPGKGTLSEAEIEFQKLVKNQLKTNFDAAQMKVGFTSSAREDMVGSAKGCLTLSQFQKVSEGDKVANELRGLGFTETQITHWLEKKGLDHSSKKRKFTPHPDFVKQGLDEMSDAKGKRDSELEAEAHAPLKISRHRQQLEAAILQGKTHLPLAHLYVKSDRRDDELGMEPSLDDIDDLAGYMLEDKRLKSYYSLSPQSSPPPSPPSSTPELSDDSSKASSKPSSPPPTPSPQQQTTTPQPQSVKLTSKIESLSREEMEKNRVPEEEIKKQFPNYEKGEPTKVLYVKNLDKNVKVEDLVSIFIQFQQEGKDKIGFKLMSGKMKGQAFITFHDEATATSALNLVHGYLYKSKPIIIQYGKAK